METKISATVQPVSSDGEQWMKLLRNKPEDLAKLERVEASLSKIKELDILIPSEKDNIAPLGLVTVIMMFVKHYHIFMKAFCLDRSKDKLPRIKKLRKNLERSNALLDQELDNVRMLRDLDTSVFTRLGINPEIVDIPVASTLIVQCKKSNSALLGYLRTYYDTESRKRDNPFINARHELAYKIACLFRRPSLEADRLPLSRNKESLYYQVLHAIIYGLEEDKEFGQDVILHDDDEIRDGVYAAAKAGIARFKKRGYFGKPRIS